MGRTGSVRQVSSQQQSSLSKRIGNWLTKIVSKGSSLTSVAKNVTTSVSMGLKAISTARSELKGFSGGEIKQSQQTIFTKLDQQIKGLEDNQLKSTLVELKTAINELGDPEAKSFKGSRAMGYPKEGLLNVINALPKDQMDNVCTLLYDGLKLRGDFYTIGIDLNYNHIKRENYGHHDFDTEKYSTKFDLKTTEYSKIEASLNSTQ